MSGGNNTSRACISETGKKESEKINAQDQRSAVDRADGEDEARMKKNAAENVVRVKPPEWLEQMLSVKKQETKAHRQYFSQ